MDKKEKQQQDMQILEKLLQPKTQDLHYLEEIDIISKNSCGLRRIGTASLDLAFVASGKLDGFWERNLNIWDVCSGVILVKEAGGKINDIDYSSNEVIKVLAGSNSIYEKMSESLNNF